MIDKKTLIAKAIEMLEEEIKSILLTIKNTEQEIRDAPNANKSHSDTTRSQKDGLLVGFTKQHGERQKILTQLKVMNWVAANKIISGSLVEVEGNKTGKRYLYFIVPGGGEIKSLSRIKTLCLFPQTPPSRWDYLATKLEMM